MAVSAIDTTGFWPKEFATRLAAQLGHLRRRLSTHIIDWPAESQIKRIFVR